jgi:predicted permease
MSDLLRDLRQAFHVLRRTPGFSLAAVLTLALGMGASTAIYTALERVVLDPLPYAEPDRLVQLKSAVPGVSPGQEWDVSAGAWFFFGREAPSLEALGAYRRGGVTVLGSDGPRRVRSAVVTAGTLRLLGARPALGRLIDEHDDDPGSAAVVVLSHGFWQRQLGGDAGVVGTTLTADERPFEVVGVMAPGFELPPERGASAEDLHADLWLPLRLNPAGPFYNSHAEFRTIARLEPGGTVEAAQRELDHLTARLPEVVPTAYSPGFMERYGFATRVYPLKTYVVGDVADSLWILLGAVGLVLLIAYANVANLFLVRAEGRRRELAIRTALGAGRRALARQVFAESLVLAVPAGLLALALSYWGVDGLASLAPEGIPRLEGVHPDGSVALFAAGLTVLGATILTGLAAWRFARAGALADGGRGATAGPERQRVRSSLVVGQVALALMLVVGAGLLVESFRRLRDVDLGFRPAGVLTMDVFLPYARYDDVPKMWPFYDDALRRVRGLPGVQAAGLTTSLPLDGGFGCTIQGFEDPEVGRRVAESGGTLCAGQEPTSPGYFEAMGIPVLRGRALTQDDLDHPERGAVVVSRAFAERFWPNEDPLGQGVGPSGRTNQQFYRVVGVVGDVRSASPADEPALAIYYPVQRIPGTSAYWPNPITLVVRTTVSDPMSLLPAIRSTMRQIDPAVPVSNVRDMRGIVSRSMARLSFMMALIGIAASAALLLAAVGLYAVVSYVVTRRTSEIGVRMALGAQAAQVAGLVVGGSVRLALAGAAVGVLAALGTSRVLRNLLYGVEPTQPAVYLAAAAVLGGVAALAAYLPARRATRVNPVEALRHE